MIPHTVYRTARRCIAPDAPREGDATTDGGKARRITARTELAPHLFFVPPTLNFELKFREHKFFMPEA
jgi:hypothetical protein